VIRLHEEAVHRVCLAGWIWILETRRVVPTGSNGLLILTGSHRFIFSLSFFPAKKSVQKGEVGSDPHEGYFF
jgi:hypothetical protein